MTTLYLVRHGATAANELRPYVLQGRRTDQPLTENGEQQAAAVGRVLSSQTIDHVYCSPLLRARQTAAAIAEHRRLPIQTIPAITECDVGEWEGLTWDEIERRNPDECRAFHADPIVNGYFGGETYQQIFDRVRPAFDELYRRHAGESFVVVAHNVVNRVYLAHLLGMELRRCRDIVQNNCGVNVITHDGNRPQVQTLNTAFHLSETAVRAKAA